MDISRNGTRPSSKGSADYFTGQVRFDPLFAAEPPLHLVGALVSFEPGARTNWHTHPLGQVLIITSGQGRVQREGGPVEAVNPGDVIRFAPGERHWHGAAPKVAMSHIALQASEDGRTADWAEPVSEAQYQGEG